MSYCVNCGVELDKTCAVCPLCNTQVINPKEPIDTDAPKPYPENKGTIDPVTRRDTTILVSVCLAATAIVCGLLNLFFFFTDTRWSLYVIGGCGVLWIFALPVFFPEKLSPYLHLLLDGLSIAMYFGIIAWLHPGNGWFLAIAAPLTAIGTLLIMLFTYALQHPRRSILSQAAVLVGEIGIFTVSIEWLVRRYQQADMTLTWSAIALTCCIIIDVTLITILRQTRLRETIRRRMHF